MARALGPGRASAEGAARLRWNKDPDQDYWYVDFGAAGDYSADLGFNERYGRWEIRVLQADSGAPDTVLKQEAFGPNNPYAHDAALDEATTRLFAWFLTEAL